MERFVRTLRERCLDFPDGVSSLHDVNVRLGAFLDDHYHDRPHASLMGNSPRQVFMGHFRTHHHEFAVDEARLRAAFTLRTSRRVRADSTLSHLGEDWQVDQSFLCKRSVTVCHGLFDAPPRPWVEHKGVRYPVHPVHPVENSTRKREPAPRAAAVKAVDFNPAQTMLDVVSGRIKE
jgi:hypothetical protein